KHRIAVPRASAPRVRDRGRHARDVNGKATVPQRSLPDPWIGSSHGIFCGHHNRLFDRIKGWKAHLDRNLVGYACAKEAQRDPMILSGQTLLNAGGADALTNSVQKSSCREPNQLPGGKLWIIVQREFLSRRSRITPNILGAGKCQIPSG